MPPRLSRGIAVLSAVFLVSLAVSPHARSQLAAPPSLSASTLSQLETAVIRALALNPETAPYPFSTSLEAGRLRISGVVGTKHAHDAAIRTLLAMTSSIDDQIVIDTAATIPAAGRTAARGGYGHPGAVRGVRPTLGTMLYTYPQPLFGYYDDPFYGFEPPIITYPPWWNAMSAARLGRARAALPPRVPPPMLGANAPVQAAPTAPAPLVEPARPPIAPAEPPNPDSKDAFEMTIDARGVATLTGVVKNPAERAEIERRIARMPGVAGVVNQLELEENAPAQAPGAEVPPEPPKPEAPRLQPPQPVEPAPAPEDATLSGRVRSAISRRPGLENTPVRVEESAGEIALSGQLPDVYEAMLAFRAAQQTPGVKGVVDRLAFDVPGPGEPNPLIRKGTPDDIEPYLKAQIQRQAGDSVHVDRVSVRGDQLEVQGTLSSQDDRRRVEAILRSMPILRGYQIQPVFRVN